MPSSGELAIYSAMYETVCCSYKMVIGAGTPFPACKSCGKAAKWLLDNSFVPKVSPTKERSPSPGQ